MSFLSSCSEYSNPSFTTILIFLFIELFMDGKFNQKISFFLNPTKFFSVSQFQKRKRNFLKETPLWEFFFSFKNYFFFTQSIEKEVEDKRDEKIV